MGREGEGWTMAQHRVGGRVVMDLSYLHEWGGVETWTLLDKGGDSRVFTSERAAIEEWLRRVEVWNREGQER